MKRTPGAFTIGPGARLKKLFGWTAENRKHETLNPLVIPSSLHALIPLAERWGVTCDVTRHDVAAKASDRDLVAFSAALAPHRDAIVDWLYSFDGATEPHEAAVFQAMLILEMEECDGPGIPGLFDWACKKHFSHPTAVTLRRLRTSYHFAQRYGLLEGVPDKVLQAVRAALAEEPSGA